jgi:hypothetical protein
MKTPSSHLFDLVHSLTKAQKRYIKVQAGSKGKDYLDLMDAILAQSVYDEQKLIEDNKASNFLKYLAVNKQYLYELLLRYLAQFGEKSIEDKIYEKISGANILLKRGMFAASLKEAKKGQKLARKYESFEMLLLLLNIEKRIFSIQQYQPKDEQYIEEQYEDEKDVLEELKNTADYSYVNQKINQFQLRFQKIQTPEHKEFLETFIQSPLLKNIDRATNFKSKINFLQANATYNFMSGNIQNAYNFNKQFLNLLEENPHFLKIYAERYLGTLNNMLIDSLSIGNYDTLDEGLNRLIQTTKLKAFNHIKNIEARVFRQRYLLLLNWCLGQKDFEKALQLIPEIKQGLELHEKNIEKHHRITFYYLNAYLLFLNKHFDAALNWCNNILNESKEDVVKEIFYFTRILNLLIHFELTNYDYLESLLISTPKYLKARRPLYRTEKSLIHYLGKVLRAVDKKERAKLSVQFNQELESLIEDPKEKRVFNYIDLRHWVSK